MKRAMIVTGALSLALGAGMWIVRAEPAADEMPPPVTVGDVEQRLADLSRETEETRKKLAQDFSARRRTLVESDEWKGFSRLERRSRLRALNEDYKEREERLKEDYKARRDELVGERQALEEQAEVEAGSAR